MRLQSRTLEAQDADKLRGVHETVLGRRLVGNMGEGSDPGESVWIRHRPRKGS